MAAAAYFSYGIVTDEGSVAVGGPQFVTLNVVSRSGSGSGFAAVGELDIAHAELGDADVVDWFSQKRRAATGSDFAPLYLQKVVAIGCALRTANYLKVWSIGELDDPEPELIRRFFDGIERFTPQLVSWNGGGFDLPVLAHRALIHGVVAEKFWDWGDQDRDFKWNSYLGRYHTRHLDLMDVLAMYQPRAAA